MWAWFDEEGATNQNRMGVPASADEDGPSDQNRTLWYVPSTMRFEVVADRCRMGELDPWMVVALLPRERALGEPVRFVCK